MRTAIISIISSIATALLVFIAMNTIVQKKENKILKERVTFTEQGIKKNLDNICLRIMEQLTNFADVVASDKDFSFSLLVENNPSSPRVIQMAPMFIGPMGFSFLEIVDSSGIILSSGNFPASAGNNIKEKLLSLSEEVTIYKDNIKGESVLTLQSQKSFKIADFKFYVMGGLTLDKRLLKNLLPNENVLLIVKYGNEYIATENIGSISPIKENTIVINDKEYPASEISLPVAAGSEGVSLLVVLKSEIKK
ncbi:MAG: hypothetical protein N2053_00680 [Chitinispirillaceae bacterium]|nr:hypothetical protein [Chitinispirillaceae bacterium]